MGAPMVHEVDACHVMLAARPVLEECPSLTRVDDAHSDQAMVGCLAFIDDVS